MLCKNYKKNQEETEDARNRNESSFGLAVLGGEKIISSDFKKLKLENKVFLGIFNTIKEKE